MNAPTTNGEPAYVMFELDLPLSTLLLSTSSSLTLALVAISPDFADKVSLGKDPVVESAEWFDAHYRVAADYELESGKKIELTSSEAGKCRFCRLSRPQVTFRKEAHALPHALGNKSLTSNYECDTCNNLFGSGIENDLGAWSLPMRWIAQIRGNGGLPTIKWSSKDNGWRFDSTDKAQQVTQYEGYEIASIDEERLELKLKLRRDPFHPVGVYKAFVKIALTIMPEDELANFHHAMSWIRDPDHSHRLMDPLTVIGTFVPGPRPFDNIRLWLLLRRKPSATLPYAILVIAFGNQMLQLIIPSTVQDNGLAGAKLEMRHFPNPYDLGRSRAGKLLPRLRHDLSNPTRIKNDFVEATYSFVAARVVEADGAVRVIGDASAFDDRSGSEDSERDGGSD